MIAASEPQEFVPCGRQHLTRHPGEVVLPSTQPQLQPESFLLHRLSQVAITDDEPQESWSIRASPSTHLQCEEELYTCGKTAVWSRGSLASDGEDSRVVLCSYTCESTVKHALWCTFHTQSSDKASFEFNPTCTTNTEEPKGTPMHSVCVVDTDNIKVFTTDGEDFVSSLQFEVENVWPTKFGLLLKRNSAETIKSPEAFRLPTLFSLLHPLDEISPVLAKRSQLSYFSEAALSVVFTCVEPSIAVLYDASSGQHSVWKIRKAKLEECRAMCVQDQYSSTVNSSSMPSTITATSATVNYFASSSDNQSSISCHTNHSSIALPLGNLSSVSLAGNKTSSLYHSRRASEGHKNSPFHSPRLDAVVNSPKPSFSRCQRSASLSTSTLYRNSPPRLSPQMTPGRHSLAFSPSLDCTPSPRSESRMLTSQSMRSVARPLFPELCLEHAWTESQPRDGGGAASKVFLSTDLVGQHYLCYMVPSRSSLLCARLEKSNNEQKLIFGVVAGLPAQDATCLAALHMVGTVDLSGAIMLYSGMNMVAKVHIAGVSAALTTSSYLSLNMGAHFGTPHAKRNSILSSSRPASAMEPARFDDAVYLLSPVPTESHTISMDFSADRSSMRQVSTPRGGKLLGLRDSVGTRLTLVYTDGSLYRVSLPELCSSPLVLRCLSALKQVLPRDKAMQLACKWYSTRNAPGSQDISPLAEWQLFIEVLLVFRCLVSNNMSKRKEKKDHNSLTVEKVFRKLVVCWTDVTVENLPLKKVSDLLGYEVAKLCLSGRDTGSPSPVLNTKKKRSSECGSEEDWDYLLRSSHHQSLGQGLACLLGIKPVAARASSVPSTGSAEVMTSASLFTCIPLVLYSLHLLYEELKLDMMLCESMPLLARLLHQLAVDLRLAEYIEHYWKDFPSHCSVRNAQPSQITEAILKKLSPPTFMPSDPPDVFAHLDMLLHNRMPLPFPYVRHVNQGCKELVQLTALIVHGSLDPAVQLGLFVRLVMPPGSRAEPQEALSAREAKSTAYPMPQRAVMLMSEMGMTRRSVSKLPAGIALLLNTVLHQCRENPPQDWPESAYELILRQDLAAQCRQLRHTINNGDRTSTINTTLPTSPSAGGNGENRKTAATPRVAECDQDDGMEAMDMELLKLRFSKDHRVAEVRRLLQSSAPVSIAITQRPEVNDHEFIEEQEKHLYALCTRTMALPLGRGMFTLRTSAPVVTETLPIPRLCLTGRVPPRGTTVDLTHIEVVPNMNLWPLFHNGVAAGLRIAPNALDIDSNWIVFNKPKGSTEVPTEHAGFLMALGLNGHLNNLAVLKTFEYLIKCHEMTSVGLLLGVAACKRGTMDVASTKLMSIHIEALLPPTSIEMDMPQNIQVAALLGVGLVYEGTAHRHIAEVLLTEIGRPPGPEMENSVDRESYSLAAGLALGLVVLGKGSQLCGLGDLAISDTLHYYMVGGHRRPLTGSQKEKYKSPSYQIREGDSANIDVTSPGATLALGMMYFDSDNRAVADWMKAPDTQYLLDFVRPDFLLLRIVARALILWRSVLPVRDWVESNVPETIRPFCLVKPRPEMPDNIDYETMNQAYCNILGGACMAIGLRYAGSANQTAFETLLYYAKMFTSLSGKSIAELAGKSTIETCLNVIVLALAMVMAGTGELEVVRLCRHLRSRVGPTVSVVTYGSHLATHAALGLLFFGGGRYTLGTSPSAVAAMLCAFFPKFPTHSNDNRYHLQAFRHLYVLAAEPRLVIPRDIDTGYLCYAHLSVVYIDATDYQEKTVRMKAPCILPELCKLERVVVEDDRYWSVVFHRDRNWDLLQNLLNNSGCLDVKQKAGCLSYLEDPHGFRSMLAKTLTCDTAISWSVSAESICAFSSDPSMVNFTRHFLERSQGGEKSRSELELIQSLTLLAYECVTQDKLTILPMWITFIKALHSLETAPSLYLTWQLKLLLTQILSCNAVKQDAHHLVAADLALSVDQCVFRTLDLWEEEMIPTLKHYLVSGVSDGDSDVMSKRLASYLAFYDIPSPRKLNLQAHQGATNPLALLVKLKHLQLSGKTVEKIALIMR